MTRHWARCSVFRIQTRLSFPITIPASRGIARHLVIHRVSNVCFSLSDFSSPRNVRLPHVKSTRFRKGNLYITCTSVCSIHSFRFLDYEGDLGQRVFTIPEQGSPEGFCGEPRQRFTF